MSGYFPHIGETDLTRIVQAIRDLSQGRSNATGTFTLTAGATSTVVTAINCGDDSKIAITPLTANAAGALATTYIPAATIVRGSFTVTHANAVSVDRTFSYIIQG